MFPTPVNTLDSKGKAHTTSVTVTGKVKTRSACLAGRKIEFTEVTPAGSFPQAVTATSHPERVFHRDPAVRHEWPDLEGRTAQR